MVHSGDDGLTYAWFQLIDKGYGLMGYWNEGVFIKQSPLCKYAFFG
ncbi:hypothetical protein LVD17_00560 [Fulvivirga ulvae]|nr:hypothetical protein [Fulvivirga ulvae]UII32329.1 hypothetical protein LVD17_00560 [Fulvivirga ulvae]